MAKDGRVHVSSVVTKSHVPFPFRRFPDLFLTATHLAVGLGETLALFGALVAAAVDNLWARSRSSCR